LHTAPTDHAISIALHTALSHLDKRKTYLRTLFIDYSSAFNTMVPSKLINKIRTLGLNTSLWRQKRFGMGLGSSKGITAAPSRAS
jgi:hypothetical protein